MCELPPGILSSVRALPSIPEFPRFGGMVLLRLTGALSVGMSRPAMNCEPATLWRLRRFAGYTGRREGWVSGEGGAAAQGGGRRLPGGGR